ncbi:pyruvate, phosphate dikinase [Sphingobium faniae]|nr:pyruvate, phosphate dikinase [Sphingobium faniae]
MSAVPYLVVLDANAPSSPDLVGGKASSLVRLMNSGARVPAAFNLTTEAYRRWSQDENLDFVRELIRKGLAKLQLQEGGWKPLIVSIRSGAPISMPGMMDTVLNVGFGETREGWEDFQYEARSAYLDQFVELVLGIEDPAENERSARASTFEDVRDKEAHVRQLCEQMGKPWPADRVEEALMASVAVFRSWNSPRAQLYRKMRGIDDALGTTVTVQQMIFGNRDAESGSGVAFTRNPTTGAPGLNGEFLWAGQGEDVVGGKETASDLTTWQSRHPAFYAEVETIGRALEVASGKVQELEFTVEGDLVYLLQCRPAKLTKVAAVVAATDMVEEGILDKVAALAYTASHGVELSALGESRLRVSATAREIGGGLGVGGGVTQGRLALSLEFARELVGRDEPVIFASIETSPKLLSVMERSAGLLTMRGGASSHAAVVARELHVPCVVGLNGVVDDGHLFLNEHSIAQGDWITIDGDSGRIFPGRAGESFSEMSAAELKLIEWAKASAS